MSEVPQTQPTAALATQSWGRTWDLCTLVLPLIAMASLVQFEIRAIASQQERWFAVLIPIFVVISIRQMLRYRTAGDPVEEEEGGFFRAIRWAIRGTAEIQPVISGVAGSPSPARARWAVGLVCSALLIFILAVLWSAPWLATVAAIGTFGGWAVGRFTKIHWPAIAAWCALLLIALPLPGNWETGLLRWMQDLAGLLAAGVLDLLRVPFLRHANLIELKDFTLNFDTACRGPFSFYALTGLAAMTMYVRSNGFTTTLLKFLTLPVWGVFLYTVRILILVLAFHLFGNDLTARINYLLVAGISFAWAYLAYWLWDLFLSVILCPVPTEVPEMAKYYNRVNQFLCWPNAVPLADVSESLDFEGMKVKTGRLTPSTQSVSARQGDWWQTPTLAIPLALILLAAGFAGVTAAAVSLRGNNSLANDLPDLTDEQLAALPSKESLPESFESWLRIAYRNEEIEAVQRVARDSRAWDFVSNNRTARFQIDLPIRGVADLMHWYARNGWEIERVVAVNGKINPNWPWLEMTVIDSYGVRGRVCYSYMTSTGKPYLALPTAEPLFPEESSNFPQRPLQESLREFAGEPPPVCLLVHQFSDSLNIDNKLDLAEFRQLYEQLREKILQDQSQRSWTIGFEN